MIFRLRNIDCPPSSLFFPALEDTCSSCCRCAKASLFCGSNASVFKNDNRADSLSPLRKLAAPSRMRDFAFTSISWVRSVDLVFIKFIIWFDSGKDFPLYKRFRQLILGLQTNSQFFSIRRCKNRFHGRFWRRLDTTGQAPDPEYNG